MAYVSKETKENIVAAVNPILKKYGIKATFAVRHYSTIVLNISAGDIDFITNYNEVSGKRYANRESWSPAETYIQVNQYWIDEHYSGAAKDFLNEVYDAIKKAGKWFDKSDAMIDYFHTAFYIDINIGRWDKPYKYNKSTVVLDNVLGFKALQALDKLQIVHVK